MRARCSKVNLLREHLTTIRHARLLAGPRWSVMIRRAADRRAARTRHPDAIALDSGAPNLTPQRDSSPKLDPDLRPRLRAPSLVQHHAQDAIDAEPGVPEAGVDVTLFVHFVSGGWQESH